MIKKETTALVQATHGSPDHPLRIGDIEIPCYVLEDKRRVIVRSRMIAALGMSEGTASASMHGDRLVKFISTKAIRKNTTQALETAIKDPIQFRTPTGQEAFGYEATVLADICEAVLAARDDPDFNYQQKNIAKQCEILIRGFARVGIIALVDEATGYQESRAREALEEILEKFIAAELMKWVKTFPDEFYRELFRLRGLHTSQFITKRPAYFGHLTNDIVYARLAPGVLEELKRITPKDPKGRREHKYFQRLTEDVGNPKLREHLSNVIVLMKASPNFQTFIRLLDRALPKFQAQGRLELDIPSDDTDSFSHKGKNKTPKRTGEHGKASPHSTEGPVEPLPLLIE